MHILISSFFGEKVMQYCREEDARKDLCDIGKKLYLRGLVNSQLGTISVLFDREQGIYITKPGDIHYDRATPDDFVKITWKRFLLERGKAQPSENWWAHAACYKKRPDISAVVHAHPLHCNILTSQRNARFKTPDGLFVSKAVTGEAVWFMKPVRANLQPIPIVGDLDPHSLARAAGRAIVHANAVLIRNHGIIAVGRDLLEAFDIVTVIEEEARIICGIYWMNGDPLFREKELIMRDISGMPPWFSKPFERQKRTKHSS